VSVQDTPAGAEVTRPEPLPLWTTVSVARLLPAGVQRYRTGAGDVVRGRRVGVAHVRIHESRRRVDHLVGMVEPGGVPQSCTATRMKFEARLAGGVGCRLPV
jgi:hypothetical protein